MCLPSELLIVNTIPNSAYLKLKRIKRLLDLGKYIQDDFEIFRLMKIT
jgi:hypothetical protein